MNRTGILLRAMSFNRQTRVHSKLPRRCNLPPFSPARRTSHAHKTTPLRHAALLGSRAGLNGERGMADRESAGGEPRGEVGGGEPQAD